MLLDSRLCTGSLPRRSSHLTQPKAKPCKINLLNTKSMAEENSHSTSESAHSSTHIHLRGPSRGARSGNLSLVIWKQQIPTPER